MVYPTQGTADPNVVLGMAGPDRVRDMKTRYGKWPPKTRYGVRWAKRMYSLWWTQTGYGRLEQCTEQIRKDKDRSVPPTLWSLSIGIYGTGEMYTIDIPVRLVREIRTSP